MRWKWNLTMVLICISLMDNGAECLSCFRWLPVFLESCLIIALARLITEMLFFLMFNFWVFMSYRCQSSGQIYRWQVFSSILEMSLCYGDLFPLLWGGFLICCVPIYQHLQWFHELLESFWESARFFLHLEVLSSSAFGLLGHALSLLTHFKLMVL